MKGHAIKDFELADTFFKRLLGLMFRQKICRPLLFIFPNPSIDEASIHSFFVFFEFDAIYLDERKRVVGIFHSIRPFTLLLRPRKPAKYLVEAPAGWARGKFIRIGDNFSW